MRLAYCVRAIYPQHGYGGLERSATSLMEHLLLAGVDIALFTRSLPPGQPISVPPNAPGRLTVHAVRYGRLRLRPNGIPARLTNYRVFVENVGRHVAGLAYRGHIDGIYAHGLCAWGVRRASEWGVPMLANPHGLEEFKVNSPLKRLAYAPFRAWVRAGCRAADRVVATDRAMRSEVSHLLGVPDSRVVVLPNGVDVDHLRALVSRDVQNELRGRFPLLRSSHATPLGISVGRLEANKGFDHLLRALAALDSEATPWRWVLVGEGSLTHDLQALSQQIGIDQRVLFAGSLSDSELHSLYAMCDLFVHPTLYEGSSLVTLEAMAHALPVVASAVGGIPDKVRDGETGGLVPPGDDAALIDKLQWMLRHSRERAEMGRQGMILAQTGFSWERVATQTKDLFAQLIEEKAACS
jgi:glycosyltransferase involved in cell wall biosynthesis